MDGTDSGTNFLNSLATLGSQYLASRNAANVVNAANANAAARDNAQPMNWKPILLIGGGVLALLVVLGLVFGGRRGN